MQFRGIQITTGRAAAALVVLAILIYGNVLGGGFIWDDEYLYLDNPNLLKETVWSAFTGGNPFAYMTGPQSYTVYRPIQVLAHTWLARLTHLDPFGIHLASLLVHAAGGVLVFLLVLEFASLPVAWITAALFIAHPLHVEAVAWMAAFSEVLAGCLMLLCLYGLVRGHRISDCGLRIADCQQDAKARNPQSTIRNPQFPWLAAAYIAAALAFLTKETSLALPLLALFFVGWRRAWPLFGLAAGALALRWKVIGLASAAIPHRPLWRHIHLVWIAALQYAKKMIWPWPLAPEYSMEHSLPAWVVFAAVCAAAVWLAWRWPRIRLALALVVVSLAPALACAVFFAAHRLAQDRFAYLAVLGVCLLAGYAAASRPGLVACLVLLLVWSGLSAAAVPHWRDSETFWSHTLRVTPDSKVAALGLGYCYYSTKRFAEAERVYRQALLLRPNDPDLLQSLDAVGKALR
jgi:tetratricopeptide (TPR) repeat protein